MSCSKLRQVFDNRRDAGEENLNEIIFIVVVLSSRKMSWENWPEKSRSSAIQKISLSSSLFAHMKMQTLMLMNIVHKSNKRCSKFTWFWSIWVINCNLSLWLWENNAQFSHWIKTDKEEGRKKNVIFLV